VDTLVGHLLGNGQATLPMVAAVDLTMQVLVKVTLLV